MNRFVDRVSLAYRTPRRIVESWPFPDVIHLIEVDKRECIGNERIEYALAAIGVIAGRAQGMDIDIYDVLGMNPWCRAERPMPTDAQLARQAGCVWCEERQQYVDPKELKKWQTNTQDY